MSCGKTIGHGETCQPGYLCGPCVRIAELKEENHAWAEKWMVERDANYRLRAAIKESLGAELTQQQADVILRAALEGRE